MGSEECLKLWERVAEDRRMGSEECLRLWMEMEARSAEGREATKDVVDETESAVQCDGLETSKKPVGNGAETKRRSGGGDDDDDTSVGERQGSTNREKEEWSPRAAVTLLEAYEERLSDGRSGNLKAKEWDEVASVVNRLLDEKRGVKSIQQCKRKVYSLRRWYKSVVSRETNFRPNGYEESLKRVLERIMTPACPSRAGIPGGIDAGERQSMPTSSSSFFDEEEDEDDDLTRSTPGIPMRGREFEGLMSSILGKRPWSGSDQSGNIEQACTGMRGSKRGPGPTRKPYRNTCGAATHSDEVVAAVNNFSKVLAQVEQTKLDIMKDLDKRRAELQLKLAHIDPDGQTLSESCPQSAMMTLL